MTDHATGEAGSGDGPGAPPRSPGRIFFSYARSDADFVLKVASALRVDGVELWVDQLDIPKGARWDESVEGALKGCSCLVVVLSPASVDSFNVLDEVYYTLGEGKRIVPLLLHPCEIPFRLKRIQYIDFTQGYQQGYEQLLATLAQPSAARPRPPPEAPKPPQPPDPPPDPDSGKRPGRVPRAGTLRHMAIGGALMFAVLTVLGLFIQSEEAQQAPVTPPGGTQPADPPSPDPGTTGIAGTGAAPTAEPPVPPPAPVSAPGGADPATTMTMAGGVGATQATGSGPAEGTLEAPARPPAPPPPEAAPAAAPEQIDAVALPFFVARFIGAHNRRDAVQIAALYDEEVSYLDHGRGAQLVLKDKQAMFATWAEVRFSLGSKIDYALSDDHRFADLAFTVDYAGNDGQSSSQGQVREVMRLRMVDGALKITAERHVAVQ